MIDLAYLIIAVVAYLLGCIPSALWLVRIVSGKDIRSEGTGNIGGMNSYDVTGKAWIGIAVALLDAAKGALAIVCAQYIFPNSSTALATAAVAVVAGHCFNVFLKGKGGRGLATAAGVSLVLNPIALVVWCASYLIGYFVIRKNIHVGSIVATIATPIILYASPHATGNELAQKILKNPNDTALIAFVHKTNDTLLTHILHSAQQYSTNATTPITTQMLRNPADSIALYKLTQTPTDRFIESAMYFAPMPAQSFKIMLAFVCALILIKHWQPLQELLSQKESSASADRSTQ